MRLVLTDRLPKRNNFYPLTLCRPIWELRSGMTTLGEKLVSRSGAGDVACFLPPYLAEVYRTQTAWPVNNMASLRGDDLLLVAGHARPAALEGMSAGPSRVALDADGEVLAARIVRADLAKMPADAMQSIDALLAAAKRLLPPVGGAAPAWNYVWELVLANAEQLTEDFRTAGRSGIEGTVEQPAGPARQSARHLRCARRRGTPAGRAGCRSGTDLYRRGGGNPSLHARGRALLYRPASDPVGGQVPRGQHHWSHVPRRRRSGRIDPARLHKQISRRFYRPCLRRPMGKPGAGTTNSDLRNDYGPVSVILDGHTPIDTGSTKVGAVDWRPYEDKHRHIAEHGGLRGGDGPVGHPRRAAAQIYPVVCLVHEGPA